MILSEFKEQLEKVSELTFLKADGVALPKHFHVTEVGQVEKKFIDCGGTVRAETVVSVQLWESIDFWHRLEPTKLLSIIDLSEKKLGIGNHTIEVEYQAGSTIGKYGIEFQDGHFVLVPTTTACLASDKCGVPTLETIITNTQTCCTPGGGCC